MRFELDLIGIRMLIGLEMYKIIECMLSMMEYGLEAI